MAGKPLAAIKFSCGGCQSLGRNRIRRRLNRRGSPVSAAYDNPFGPTTLSRFQRFMAMDGRTMAAPPTSEEIWPIGRLLDWTQQFFAKKRLESPRLDAELLLAHVLRCTRIELYTSYDAEVGDSDRTAFKDLVKR